MELEELSVGDWVYNEHHKKNIQITPYDFFTHGHDEDGVQYLSIAPKQTSGRDLQGVPITKEILEKNGFIEIEEDIYKCCVGEVYIEICIYKPMFIYIGARVITPDEVYDADISSTAKANGGDFFVHDLQHALRLCGINKKIIL